VLFFIAERLHLSVTAVERMSPREVFGWLAWFGQAAKAPAIAAPPDDAVNVRELSQAELRRMFPARKARK
jgi:hypothetical protein